MKLSFSNVGPVKTGNPETDALFVAFENMLIDAIEIPNVSEEWGNLPVGFADSRRPFVSLRALSNKCNKQDKRNGHKRLKAEKARRVALMRAQNERGEELTYNVNERMLNNREIAFCAAAIRGGYMEPIDSDE